MLISAFPISNRTKNILLNNGFLTEKDLEGKFLEDIKSLEGMGAKGLVEIRDYLYGKFGILLKNKPKPKKISNPKEARSVILHFIGNQNNIYWPKEMMNANKLLALFDYKILLTVVPNDKVRTLAYYLCEDGRKYIRMYLPSIKIESKKEEESPEITEDVQLNLDFSSKKPKSIKDFLFK
jgi:hypothetical protein